MAKAQPAKETGPWTGLRKRWSEFFRRPTRKRLGALVVAVATSGTAAYNLLPDDIVGPIKTGLYRRIGLAEKQPYAFPFLETERLELLAELWDPNPGGVETRGVAGGKYRVVAPGSTLLFQIPADQEMTDFQAEFVLALTGVEDSASWLAHTDGSEGYLFRLTYPTAQKPAAFEGFALKGGKPEARLFPAEQERLYEGVIQPDHLLAVTVRVKGSVAITTLTLHHDMMVQPCAEPGGFCEPSTAAERRAWLSREHSWVSQPPIVLRPPLKGTAKGGTFGFRAEGRTPLLVRDVRLTR